MTLAVRTSNGDLWVGGVRCETCGRDTRFNTRTRRCPQGHDGAYAPKGLRIRTLDGVSYFGRVER